MISKKATLRVLLGSAMAVAATGRAAHADEPVAAGEPRLLDETAEATSVVDAFDKGDPFDLNITVGFQQSWKRADIHRETALNQPGLSTGGFVSNNENVARFSQDLSILNVGADVGIYHDLALVFRMPIVLADSRQLGDLDGSSKNPQRLYDPTGAPLFSVPFKSPTRSGIDYFSVGLNWAPLNQQRDHTKPTWVIGAEGRFGVGSPLHACDATQSSDSPRCPDPANPSDTTRDPGLSRAMYGVDVKTVISRRFGYVEPYTGFEFLADFPRSDSDFGKTNNFRGALVNHPPLVGTFTIGLEVVPWERREAWQRLVFDVRVQGIYNSPGREYSELFDALGSSTAPTLRSANPSAYMAGPNGSSIADPSAQQVYFTGITDQQAYGALSAQAGVTWQAGQYVKFNLSGGVRLNESHAVTAADPCNPNVSADAASSGPCRTADPNSATQRVTGIPNPNYRAVIDAPGHRFTVDNTVIGSLMVSGVVMF